MRPWSRLAIFSLIAILAACGADSPADTTADSGGGDSGGGDAENDSGDDDSRDDTAEDTGNDDTLEDAVDDTGEDTADSADSSDTPDLIDTDTDTETDADDDTSDADVTCADGDEDGVCDADDLCEGFADGEDADGDSVADGCDVCPDDEFDDSDADGSCDSDDICDGFDDTADVDADGVPNRCDICPLDALDDSDDDGSCDSDDLCAGFDDATDGDADGIPDNCDECPVDSPNDSDDDGVCDSDDVCAGFDDAADRDGDGFPNACDACPLGDDAIDGDADEVADACDTCPLDNPDDADEDSLCDSDPLDTCIGTQNTVGNVGNYDGDAYCDDVDRCTDGDDDVDSDDDGVPDACDRCPGFDDAADGDADGVADACDNCADDSNTPQTNSDSAYLATATPIDFAPRPSPSTALPLADDEVRTVPLGFSFNFYGEEHDSIFVSSNGFASFDPDAGDACCVGQSLTAGTYGVIALYWDDLSPNLTGRVAYETVGEPGAREFILAFEGVQHFGTPTALVSTQLVLFEADSSIEVHTTSATADTSAHSQGVRAPDGRSGAFAPGRSAAIFSLADDGMRFTTEGTNDRVGDVCDACPFAAPDDADDDLVCDDEDICPDFDNRIDTDGDGIPDGCDPCNVGFEYPAGSGSCIDAYCDVITCNDVGTCENLERGFVCTCDDGYGGEQCGSCSDGYVRSPSDATACIPDPCLSTDCGATATCNSSSGEAVCECNPGWAGASCDVCVRYVDADAAALGNGLSWARAYRSPRQAASSATNAIDDGASSCEVWIAEGTYYMQSLGVIELRDHVYLYGGFAGGETDNEQRNGVEHPTIIDGRRSVDDGETRSNWLVRARGTDLLIDSLTFQYGNAIIGGGDDKGGAIAADAADLVVRDSVFRFNHANGSGGAIFVEEWSGPSTLSVQSCVFEENSSDQAGGAIASNAQSNEIYNSTFSENAADSGGAVSLGGWVAIDRSSFDHNSAREGGSVYLVGSAMDSYIDRTEITASSAGVRGGGLLAVNPVYITVRNSLITGNTAEYGAGVAFAGERLANAATLLNVTIAGNACSTLHCGVSTGGLVPFVVNTIIAQNFGLDSDDDEISTEVTALSSLIESFLPPGIGNVIGDPGFAFSPNLVGIVAAVDPGVGVSTVLPTFGPGTRTNVMLGRDGIARTIVSGSGSEFVLSPPPGADIEPGDLVEFWFDDAADYPEYGLNPDISICIDAGTTALNATDYDFFGAPRVDWPAIPNTGAGSPSYYDIGAIEFYSP